MNLATTQKVEFSAEWADATLFSRIMDDLKTYEGDWTRQGFWAMVVYRFGRWRYSLKPDWIRKPFSLLYHVLFKFIQILAGIELPCEVTVGRRLRIDHSGGIVISGFVRIGDDCTLRTGVTIGLRRINEPHGPQIGNRVDIGAGAKILGNIQVGDDVLIGANAVVLDNIPPNSVAVGIPAKIISRAHND